MKSIVIAATLPYIPPPLYKNTDSLIKEQSVLLLLQVLHLLVLGRLAHEVVLGRIDIILNDVFLTVLNDHV